MYVSDRPELDLDLAAWRKALVGWRVNGRKTFDLDKPRHRDALEELLSRREKPLYFEKCAALLRRYGDEPTITDDNMKSEFDQPWYRSH